MATTRNKSRPVISPNAYCGRTGCTLQFIHWHEDDKNVVVPSMYATAEKSNPRPFAGKPVFLQPLKVEQKDEDPMAPTEDPVAGTPEKIRQELMRQLNDSTLMASHPFVPVVENKTEKAFDALVNQIDNLNKKISWMGEQFTEAFKVHRGHNMDDFGSFKQHLANDFEVFKKKLQALSDFTAGVRALRQPLGAWTTVAAVVVGSAITSIIIIGSVLALRVFTG